jgi:hypothetical protein
MNDEIKKKITVVMGEFTFAEPSFRTASRIVAIKEWDGYVHFSLEQQSKDEPGVWMEDPSFPWHRANFDSLVCACAQFHDKIQNVVTRYKQKP